jgi:hypothetical protein
MIPLEPVVTNSCAFSIRTRGYGCELAPGFPCASYFEKACVSLINSDASRRESADVHPNVIANWLVEIESDERNAKIHKGGICLEHDTTNVVLLIWFALSDGLRGALNPGNVALSPHLFRERKSGSLVFNPASLIEIRRFPCDPKLPSRRC